MKEEIKSLKKFAELSKGVGQDFFMHPDAAIEMFERVEALQSRLKELNQKVEELEKENRYLNDGCAELEAHIQALEKENATLKKDAARLDWLEASKDSHGFCHSGYGEYRYYAHQVNGFKSVREVIDAAMQANKETNA